MSSNLMRWCGPALILGGLLWVLTYLTEIVIGVTAGEVQPSVRRCAPGYVCFLLLGRVTFPAAIP